MKTGLALHPATEKRLSDFAASPGHAVLLVGPSGSGKASLASLLAAELLALETEMVGSHPYVLLIRPLDGKQIPIESVRELEQFLSLKVPSSSQVNRVVIIEDAHLLGVEAQNALLKTLEEPPVGTLLILTASHSQALLPTIRSRAATIQVTRPAKEQLESHFVGEARTIAQVYAISGGLPGLMHALLADEEHQLRVATEKARQLLGQSAFERLAGLDELAKDKSLAIGVCFILQQMAHVSLQSAKGQASKRWQRILEISYETSESLQNSAQPKLALTKLMLGL